MTRTLLAGLVSPVAFLISSCGLAPQVELIPGDPGAPSQVEPSEAIAIAQELAGHQWKPFANNILHGRDKQGIVVHTPDIGHARDTKRKGWWVPGEVNVGIPYKWGGFDGPDDFDAAIASGLAGGDVSSPAKRRANNAGVSRFAAGLDCSGYVSKCLKLPTVHDTSQLPSVCEVIADPYSVQPGDLMNIPRGHVLLLAGWAKRDKSWIYYYDTGGGPDYWRPSLKKAPTRKLLDLGYQTLRYKGMARAADGKVVIKSPLLTRSITNRALAVDEPTIGEP